MIEQKGRVIERKGSRVLVVLGPAQGCSACDAGKGCGAGLLGRLLRRQPLTLQLENSLDAQAGDGVNVGIPEQRYLGLVGRLYLLPLIVGLAGAGLGNYLAVQLTKQPALIDLASLVLGVLAAAIALSVTDRRQPDLQRVISSDWVRLVSLDHSRPACGVVEGSSGFEP